MFQVLLLSFLFLASGAHRLSLPQSFDTSNRYLFTLNADIDADGHVKLLQDLQSKAVVKRQDGQAFEGVTHQYNLTNFQGYAEHFDSSVLQWLKSHSGLETIEPDRIWRQSGIVEQKDAQPSLSLISHRIDEGHDIYAYDSSAGAGTFGYVIDSGINVKHVEFEGRASLGYNAVKGAKFVDDTGHGTHMAGVMGSKTYGVAKKCKLIAVKAASGETSSVSQTLDAFTWAAKDIHKKKRQAKAVINISITGEYSKLFNDAVDAAFNAGITTVTCAGNFGSDAAKFSPASSKSAITVSSADMHYTRAKDANFGKHVDVFAPGVGIDGPWIGNQVAIKRASGTSQASANVAGLALYLKGLFNLPDAKTTAHKIYELATPGVVKDPKDSKNLFAYNGSDK